MIILSLLATKDKSLSVKTTQNPNIYENKFNLYYFILFGFVVSIFSSRQGIRENKRGSTQCTFCKTKEKKTNTSLLKTKWFQT